VGTYQLENLQYSDDRKGPWRMYLYREDGYHRGGIWFRSTAKERKRIEESLEGKPTKHSRNPGAYEEIQSQYQDVLTDVQARILFDGEFEGGKEIRICDGGDMLVCHVVNRKFLYGEKFWDEL
jgi:hypothetical protein